MMQPATTRSSNAATRSRRRYVNTQAHAHRQPSQRNDGAFTASSPHRPLTHSLTHSLTHCRSTNVDRSIDVLSFVRRRRCVWRFGYHSFVRSFVRPSVRSLAWCVVVVVRSSHTNEFGGLRQADVVWRGVTLCGVGRTQSGNGEREWTTRVCEPIGGLRRKTGYPSIGGFKLVASRVTATWTNHHFVVDTTC